MTCESGGDGKEIHDFGFFIKRSLKKKPSRPFADSLPCPHALEF